MRADQMSTQEARTGSWKSESRVRDGGQRSPVTGDAMRDLLP